MAEYNDPDNFPRYEDLTPEERAREDAMNDANDEDTFGFMRDLTGEEREKAIADAEKNLAWGYGEGLYECMLIHGYDYDDDGNAVDGDGNVIPTDGGSELFKKDVARHKQVYAYSLAAMHDVPKSNVTVNPDGTITLLDRDGATVNYDTGFVRQ